MLNINRHELALLRTALEALRHGADPTTNNTTLSPQRWYACRLVCAEIDALIARLAELEKK